MEVGGCFGEMGGREGGRGVEEGDLGMISPLESAKCSFFFSNSNNSSHR